MNALYFVVLSVSTEREKVLITKDIEALDQNAAVHTLGCASNEKLFTFQKELFTRIFTIKLNTITTILILPLPELMER